MLCEYKRRFTQVYWNALCMIQSTIGEQSVRHVSCAIPYETDPSVSRIWTLNPAMLHLPCLDLCLMWTPFVWYVTPLEWLRPKIRTKRHTTQLIASLDQPWDRHTETDTTYDCCDHPEIHTGTDTTHDCCGHPEISTLGQTHCDVDHLHSASGLVIVPVIFRPSLSERIVTAAWRHQSHVTLLLKVAVSQ